MSLKTDIIRAVENGLLRLREHEIIVKSASISAKESDGVCRIRTGKLPRYEHSIESYLSVLESDTIVTRTYSTIHLEYDVRDDEIVGHRLVYFPCPVLIREADEEFDVADYVASCDLRSQAMLISPLRFDFTPTEARENHSASHVHLGPDARLPVSGPVHPIRFFRTIVGLYYPEQFEAVEADLASSGFGRRTLTARENIELFLNAD
ncbi:MAG: hypothetical protein DI536_22780 [Archangium gephyra]|uniref:DUF2290 domain-containing protein n=1 Tax=Archangium gephyra TaxID=48 RepID=A0A2W5TDD0_9BACT|nr:MAG: hypothetical protein DI536_22780 [Archangium gephyra]